MDILSTQFYVIDSKLFNSSNINFQFNNSDYNTYEVMRFSRQVLVFLDDHLERMERGIIQMGYNKHFSKASAVENLLLLIRKIAGYEGNIKLLCKVQSDALSFAAYGIPHFYPAPEMYREGVVLQTLPFERPNPFIKQIHIANQVMEKVSASRGKDAYEFLLINHKGFITEGSKSNFFLIKDASLYSAPEKYILSGITRKYALHIAAENGIPVMQKRISTEELEQFEAAFICGTSPKILPIRRVNDQAFDPGHTVIKILMKAYDKIMEEHISDKQNNKIYQP